MLPDQHAAHDRTSCAQTTDSSLMSANGLPTEDQEARQLRLLQADLESVFGSEKAVQLLLAQDGAQKWDGWKHLQKMDPHSDDSLPFAWRLLRIAENNKAVHCPEI